LAIFNQKGSSIMSWYLAVLKKYAVFSGRARRREYWMFFLFNFLISFGLGFIEGAIGIPGIISFLYCCAVIIPGLAVCVRRLHDTGRSGWWFFIAFVPIAGGIILLVLLLLDSTPGDNQYGINPKTLSAVEM
jgi:uncharacterized membrane protein YhaH (DUF805 family)